MTKLNFPPRVRFNWGYHDAVADVTKKRVRQFPVPEDAAYCAGYRIGAEHAKEQRASQLSDEAWAQHVAEIHARARVRAARRAPARRV